MGASHCTTLGASTLIIHPPPAVAVVEVVCANGGKLAENITGTLHYTLL